MAEAARDAARHRVKVRTHRVFHDLLVELLEEAGLPAPARELARMHNDKTVEPPDELRGGGVVWTKIRIRTSPASWSSEPPPSPTPTRAGG